MPRLYPAIALASDLWSRLEDGQPRCAEDRAALARMARELAEMLAPVVPAAPAPKPEPESALMPEPEPPPVPREVSIVLRGVARAFGVTRALLVRPGPGVHRVAHARQVAMLLLKEDVGLSLYETGQHLGGRNHQTVIWGCRRAAERVGRDPVLAAKVKAIRATLFAVVAA